VFFFSSRRRHTRFSRDWSSDVCSSDLARVDGQVNLKLSGEPLPYDQGEFGRLSALIDDRPVVVAASTHEHEEMAIVGALDHLARSEERRVGKECRRSGAAGQ